MIRRAPIVLVGGFTVWGREEAFGIKYWGGPGRDIQDDLRAKGHPTVTAAPGPFSSNWDRAAEVYAQLRGGTVDYGRAHAERFGHARFGRAYPGLLPDWEQGAHFIGHSMGGQTIRVLAHLLAEGSEEERLATPEGELSPLFRGGHPGVKSLTTLATPHLGTTLTRKREALEGVAQRILALAGGLTSSVYDLKLDQWGLQRFPPESWKAYRDRILATPLWTGTADFSARELSPEGARDLNAWVRLPAEVPAFSWSTAKTEPGPGGFHVPAPHMNLLWRSGARYIGKAPGAGPDWFRSDGVVNTVSMAGPGGDPVEPYGGTPRPGVWSHMGILEGWDHSEILGMGPEHGDEVLPFYRAWAGFLDGIRP